MGFWESVQYGIWKVKAFFGDSDAATHAESLKQVTSEVTPTDTYINDLVNSQVVEGPKIPIFSDLTDAISGTFKGLGDTFRNLPKFLLVIVVFLGIYLILMGRKGKAIL